MGIAAVVVNGTKDIDSEACYQIPIGIQFIWAFILGIGLILLPESPRWLIMKGKEDKAQRSLSRLLQQPVESEAVTRYYAEIAGNLHHEMDIAETSYLACFKGGP